MFSQHEIFRRRPLRNCCGRSVKKEFGERKRDLGRKRRLGDLGEKIITMRNRRARCVKKEFGERKRAWGEKGDLGTSRKRTLERRILRRDLCARCVTSAPAA